MRRLLVPVLIGTAVAMAGCQGINVKLDTSPTKHSSSHSTSHSKSHSTSSPSAVPAAGPVSAGSGALRVIAEPQAGLSDDLQAHQRGEVVD